jgi:hypothetical protein
MHNFRNAKWALLSQTSIQFVNPYFPLGPSFPSRRESCRKNTPRSGQAGKLTCFAVVFDELVSRLRVNDVFCSIGKSRLKQLIFALHLGYSTALNIQSCAQAG